ncbi:hypothetical protein SEA_CAMERICO_72 [Gordonia phage Camerico]|nr:hypothetical protein SEA_CAMERICO_72 [Gordonia phage Camerico]
MRLTKDEIRELKEANKRRCRLRFVNDGWENTDVYWNYINDTPVIFGGFIKTWDKSEELVFISVANILKIEVLA